MARREKKPVHKVVMTEGKRNIIQQLLQEYGIETAEDIQDALKDLLGGTIKEMMEAEMDDHLGYQKSERSDIDQKIISMYAKGMTTRQISETIEDIYDFETSEGFISDVTDKILPQIEDWQNRPLDEVYPVLYIDASISACSFSAFKILTSARNFSNSLISSGHFRLPRLSLKASTPPASYLTI